MSKLHKQARVEADAIRIRHATLEVCLVEAEAMRIRRATHWSIKHHDCACQNCTLCTGAPKERARTAYSCILAGAIRVWLAAHTEQNYMHSCAVNNSRGREKKCRL